MSELAEKWEGFPPPEARLPGAILAGPLLVIGCFWLGWTGEYSYIPWYVPMLSTIPIGCAVNLMFASLLVSCSYSFAELLLIPYSELPDGYIFVCSYPWTLSTGSNASQECIQHPLSPLTPCFVVGLALRSLYLPQRCLKGFVLKITPSRRLLIGVHSWA